jgi:uncharacterized protein
MRKALHVAATIALAALAAGCFGRSPTSEFFTLSPVAKVAGLAPLTSRPNLGLVVGPTQFPRYLERPEIVTRDGDHRLVLEEWHRWGGSLRTDILRVVADDLGTLLGTTRIAVYPAEATFPVDYRILLDVREFEGTVGGSVRLRVLWSVVSAATGKALVVDASDIEQPIGSASWADLVAAHSAALGVMTRQIATRVAGLSAH